MVRRSTIPGASTDIGWVTVQLAASAAATRVDMFHAMMVVEATPTAILMHRTSKSDQAIAKT